MASKDPVGTSANADKPTHEGVEMAATATARSDIDVKEVNVRSVELTDALAKDKPNYRSRSQIALYAFMLFGTLSKFPHTTDIDEGWTPS